MPSAKSIVIEHRDLYLPVRRQARDIVSARKSRIGGAVASVFPGAIVGGVIGVVPSWLADKPFNEYSRRDIGVSAGVSATALAFLGYKLGSRSVRLRTNELVDVIRSARTIDARGRFKPNEIRRTHPFLYVNQKGDVVLVPKTIFQKAIASAQHSFLKEIIPTRYRTRL